MISFVTQSDGSGDMIDIFELPNTPMRASFSVFGYFFLGSTTQNPLVPQCHLVA